MVDISTYGLQIIRAPDVIFLWPKWQLRCSNAREGKKTDREKKSDKRLQEKMGSVRWMMQAWTQALDLPTGSCPVTSKYNILPHDHWQPKTEMATKEVYLKLRMCCFFLFSFGLVYQKQALQQEPWWEHGFTVIGIIFDTSFWACFSFHTINLKLCCGYLLLACLSKLPQQHLFYSNAWHSLSNTGKHTSHNFIPTDVHIDREGGRTKTERDLDCIRKSIMSGFVFQFQKKMNAFKLLQKY